MNNFEKCHFSGFSDNVKLFLTWLVNINKQNKG